MNRLQLNTAEFDTYYVRYIDKLSERTTLREGFKTGKENVIRFFRSIPKNTLEYRYEEGKWTIKEILQHLIDTERIFMYRCFRIARNDATALAGFDQNIYITPSNASGKPIEELIREFEVNRNNSICLLESLTDKNLCFVGNANGGNMSARAAAFTIIGHDIWHMEVIEQRYL